MNSVFENKIKQSVETFVVSLEGRYREHCSDRMLTALLWQILCAPSPVHHYISRIELVLVSPDTASNEFYDVGVRVFESLLECQCGVISNGHHVAQRFAAQMEQAIKTNLEEWKANLALGS